MSTRYHCVPKTTMTLYWPKNYMRYTTKQAPVINLTSDNAALLAMRWNFSKHYFNADQQGIVSGQKTY